MKVNRDFSKNRIGTDIVDEAISRWPNMATHMLAVKVFKENPGVWSGVDTVRSSIRYRRGASGASHRSFRFSMKTTKKLLPEPENNPFSLPPSDEIPFVPYVIDCSVPIKVLLLSDLQIPYHSISALTAAIEDGKRHGVDVVILNGDTVDCYQLSRFENDPRRRGFSGEVESVKQFLDALEREFPNADLVWKDGNHDERLEKHLIKRVPEIIKAGLLNWPGILDFGGREITYVSEKRPIRLGKLNILHGHEYPNAISSPVNPARGLFLRAKTSTIAGHWHQTSEHSEGTLNEELVTCWSTGCLCELHPKYMPLNKWNHGHAIIDVEPTGDYRVHNRRTKGGRIY